MKRFITLTLALALGLALAAIGSAHAGEGHRSGARGEHSPMPGMMQGPMSETMRGIGMGHGGDLLGRERPLLSLALRHRADLALSDDQAKTLEGLIDRFRKEAEPRAGAIEAAERNLAALLQQEPADLAKVEAKVREIAAARADLRIARIKTIAEGRAALTPEQRQKLEALLATGSPHRGERRSDLAPGTRDGASTRGAEEMHRFMNSERAPQAMTAMMDMARRMGDGDTMLGMVRMMEMMGSMGDMMGGSRHQEQPPQEQK